jgi:peptidylprolyl isomerase
MSEPNNSNTGTAHNGDGATPIPVSGGQVSGAAAEGGGAASNSIPINGTVGGNSSSEQPAAQKLPGPADFEVYEQYKNQKAALLADIVLGTGPEVAMGSTVTVHYRGWLINGKVFDESYGRGQPYSFVEGEHRVILGWEQGLFGMKTGGKRRLIIPSAVGYGEQAMGSIPPNSLLVFDVELVGVK